MQSKLFEIDTKNTTNTTLTRSYAYAHVIFCKISRMFPGNWQKRNEEILALHNLNPD